MFNLQKARARKGGLLGKREECIKMSPRLGILHEEPHNMGNLAILVEDVICAVKSDTEQLTAQSEVTKLM